MNDEVEKIKQQMRYQGRVRYLADAAKKNILNSGIPNRYMQIKANELESMLCPNFHKGENYSPKALVEYIYQEPLKVLKNNSIILIDGSDSFMDRKKAGCALLFRFMAAGKTGLVKNFPDIIEDFKKFISLNTYDLEQELKAKDVLFMTEFRKDVLVKSPNAALNFLDGILEYRYDNGLTTIFSFTKTLPSNEVDALEDQTCGLFMPLLINHDIKNQLDALRIRIK